MEKLKRLSDLKGKARKACPVKGKLGKVFAVALVALMAAFGIVNYDILDSNAAEVSSGWSAAYYTGSNNRYFKSVLIYSYSTSATTVSMSANTNMQIDGGKGVDATWYGWQTGGYTGTGSTQYKSSSISGRVSGRNWCPLVGTKSYSANRGCTASSYGISGLVKCTGKSTLKGWYNTSVTATVSIPVPARDKYTITYNANEGTGAPATNAINSCSGCSSKTHGKCYGYNCTLSTVEPTRPGYDFAGWNTAADGSGTNYAAGGTYTANAAVTLYAQWSNGETDITFNSDGGSAVSNKTMTYLQQDNLDAPVPTKDRCAFAGWYGPNIDGEGECMVYDASGHPNTSESGYWAIEDEGTPDEHCEWKYIGETVTLKAHWRDLETYSLVKKEDAHDVAVSQFTAGPDGTYDYQDQLAHSEWFRILNLPKGAKYVVTEEGTPQYQPKYKKTIIEDQ